jgi:tol-pal system protein YbgF
MSIHTKRSVWLLVLALPCMAMADSVEDGYLSGPDEAMVVEATPVLNTGDIQAQVARLDQQLQHVQQQDYLAKIGHLQQEIQSLRGAIDVQAHDLALLKQQMSPHEVAVKPALPAPVADAEDKTEVAAYQSAFNYLKSRDYSHATTAFNTFLSTYPEGKYSPNAHYWLGEIYLLQGQYTMAEANLRQVIEQHQQHNKTPDAMLKLAMVYVNTKQPEQAKVLVSQLQAKYPETTAAKMAKMQLGSL